MSVTVNSIPLWGQRHCRDWHTGSPCDRGQQFTKTLVHCAGPDGAPPCGSGSGATCCTTDQCCSTTNSGVPNRCTSSGRGDDDSGGFNLGGGYGRKLQTYSFNFGDMINGCSGGSNDMCKCKTSCGSKVTFINFPLAVLKCPPRISVSEQANHARIIGPHAARSSVDMLLLK